MVLPNLLTANPPSPPYTHTDTRIQSRIASFRGNFCTNQRGRLNAPDVFWWSKQSYWHSSLDRDSCERPPPLFTHHPIPSPRRHDATFEVTATGYAYITGSRPQPCKNEVAWIKKLISTSHFHTPWPTDAVCICTWPHNAPVWSIHLGCWNFWAPLLCWNCYL